MYYDDALKKDVLVCSTQTGFEVDMVVEMIGQVEVLSASFEGLATCYNRFHNRRFPTDTMARRQQLVSKRMMEVYMLYGLLDLGQRYSIPNYQVMEGDVDNAILSHAEELQDAFSRRWINHSCDVPGCGSVMTIDGGLKPHRMLCGAKLSGLREFKEAGISHFTGCTRHP